MGAGTELTIHFCSAIFQPAPPQQTERTGLIAKHRRSFFNCQVAHTIPDPPQALHHFATSTTDSNKPSKLLQV